MCGVIELLFRVAFGGNALQSAGPVVQQALFTALAKSKSFAASWRMN
jgi:hypothetical protein